MENLDFNGFSRVEVLQIIDCMKILSDACEERGVKFSKYTEEELYKILRIYRAWRLSDEPPF
jgi:Cdc6-like AAA superfamily ATPase